MKSLKSTKRIIAILRDGKIFEGSFIKVHYRCNDTEEAGYAIAISRKLGKAVKRNYVKRIIRSYLKNSPFNYDLLIRPKTLDVTYRDVVKDFEKFRELISV